MDLVCPKCQGAMRTYERNGVHVDQCTECRGIFLDRGELERLVDAENSWHGAPQGRPGAQPQQHGTPQQYGAPQHGTQYPAAAGGAGLGAVVNEVLGAVTRGSSHGSGHGSSHGSYGAKKRKESFLSDLFG
jgi:hypothetical protein